MCIEFMSRVVSGLTADMLGWKNPQEVYAGIRKLQMHVGISEQHSSRYNLYEQAMQDMRCITTAVAGKHS
jgi:hypothetical protein